MRPTDWKSWIERMQAEGKLPTAGQTLEAMSAALRRGLATVEGEPMELAEIRHLQIPGPAGFMEARLYTPYAAGVAPAPGLVFFHGGGFVLCDLDTHDRLCRRLSAASYVRILSVAYRLAPQHRFPAAVDDALAAFDWATGPGAALVGFDPARVAVGGDSAGGNLAAVVAQARRRGGESAAAAFQLLLYPLLQLAETNVRRQRLLEGHALATAILDGVRDSYLAPEHDPRDPRASPLLTDDLFGVCPAYVITAGLDPLHHEGRAYVDRLAAAGVRVGHEHYPTVPHGFLQLAAILGIAVDAVDRAGAELATGLRRAPRLAA
jgi:acetyl esterase